MEDDKRNRYGVFQTGQKGTVPPLVTTEFVVEDQGIFYSSVQEYSHMLCPTVLVCFCIDT